MQGHVTFGRVEWRIDGVIAVRLVHDDESLKIQIVDLEQAAMLAHDNVGAGGGGP